MSEPHAAADRVRGPAEPVFVDAVQDLLAGLVQNAPEVGPEDAMPFELAVVEVVANAVKHATPGTENELELEFELEIHSHVLVARLYEIGAAPFELPAQAEAMPDEQAESGRGLALARRLLSTISCERHGDSNVWTLTRRSGGGSGTE
jgi:serine/threonine-protein kinase RsbW